MLRVMTSILLLLSAAVLVWACAGGPSLPLPTGSGADPTVAQHNAEGMEHYEMGHWKEAKGHFEAAIQADPKSAEPHYNLALTLDKMGAHAEATAHFKQAAELAPGNRAIAQSRAYRSHVMAPSGQKSRGDEGYGVMGGY